MQAKRYQALPPIYRDIKRLVVMTEETVKKFHRYHRYTIGSDLRKQAARLLRLVHRAWLDKANAAQWVHKLLWAIDDFRLQLQMAKELNALQSFGQFEQIGKLCQQIGKQCGGWQRALAAKPMVQQ